MFSAYDQITFVLFGNEVMMTLGGSYSRPRYCINDHCALQGTKISATQGVLPSACMETSGETWQTMAMAPGFALFYCIEVEVSVAMNPTSQLDMGTLAWYRTAWGYEYYTKRESQGQANQIAFIIDQPISPTGKSTRCYLNLLSFSAIFFPE